MSRPTAGEKLATHTDLEALASEATELVRRLFCCSYVALWVGCPGQPGLSLVRAVGSASGSSRCSRVLSVGDRELARLELDLPAWRAGDPPPLLDALLPWLALGVAGCVRAGRDGEPTMRLERLGADWRLSRRQREVLRLLIRGAGNKEVAGELGLSAKTVEAHVSQLLRRSGAASRGELLARVIAAR